MNSVVEQVLDEAAACLEALRRDKAMIERIAQAGEQLARTFEQGGRAYSCGNGGSMSDAMHFAEELTGRFRGNRRGLPATAISDAGHITCAGNDFGYEYIFARYIESHGRKGDFLLAISTSGTSPNIIKAAQTAKNLDMFVVALTGKEHTPLEEIADICLITKGRKFADRVQELHIKVIHTLIEITERRLFPENYQ